MKQEPRDSEVDDQNNQHLFSDEVKQECQNQNGSKIQVPNNNQARPTVPYIIRRKFYSKYICDFCDDQFQYKHLCARHMKKEHKCFRDIERLGRYICQFCHKSLNGRLAHRLHLKKVHSFPKRKKNPEPPGICDECDIFFKRKSQCVCHYRKFHLKMILKDSSGFCPICPNGKFYVKLHIHMNVHKGQNPVCDDCGKSFADRVSLIGHVGLHLPSNKRKYKCKFCKKAFSSNGVRVRHEDIHKTSYSCEECAKTFTQKGSLTIHKKLHLPMEQRPYGCEFCQMRFITKWYKVQHEKKKHCSMLLSKKQNSVSEFSTDFTKELTSEMALKVADALRFF